jgi:hypothetical protein
VKRESTLKTAVKELATSKNEIEFVVKMTPPEDIAEETLNGTDG